MQILNYGMPKLSFIGRGKAYLDIVWQVTYCFAKRLEVSVFKKRKAFLSQEVGQDSEKAFGI